MGLFKPDVEKLAAKRDFKGLIAALAHRKVDVRKCAADAIRRLAKEGTFDSAAVKPLIASLSDGDESGDFLIFSGAWIMAKKINHRGHGGHRRAEINSYSPAGENPA